MKGQMSGMRVLMSDRRGGAGASNLMLYLKIWLRQNGVCEAECVKNWELMGLKESAGGVTFRVLLMV